MEKTLRIVSRKSPLALRQADIIKQKLEALYPSLHIELLGVTTEGDRYLNSSLKAIGGKGAFVKELEQALLEKRADIAVHSMKDVPVDLPQGLTLAVITEREDPRDAFVSNHFPHFGSLPIGAKVGTASLRRQCQIKIMRPDLDVESLRGNVGSRLNRLDKNEFSAIILAASGLIRLGMRHVIRDYFSIEQSLPAAGQGALGIECRSEDQVILNYLQPLNHSITYDCVLAERAVNRVLNGGCQTPVGAYAEIKGTTLCLRGMVGKPDGSLVLHSHAEGLQKDAETLGIQVALELLAKGAKDILEAH